MTVNELATYAPMVAVTIATVFAVMGAVWLGRYIAADSMMRASMRQAIRVRRGWKRLAQMAGLSVTDKVPTALASLTTTDADKPPKPRVLTPVLKVKPDRFGLLVRANCLPKVGLEEFQKAARFLADAWRCTRVSVQPDGPGRVLIRGVRVDPLITATAHVPSGKPPKKLTTWNLGLDEYAQNVAVDLAEVPGVTVAGLPGYGKSSLINRFICDCAPSPAIQFAVADGKVTSSRVGDYADLADRLFAFVGSDLEEGNKLFQRLVDLREARTLAMKDVLKTKDMWHVGPTAAWPLVVLIMDEAHTYFRDYKGSDPKTKKLAALAAENARLVENLVKMGRSVGILVILTSQKTTGDAIPTFIRDVCPVGLSFAQKTAEASVAALGEAIRDWPDANPIHLQDPAYVGVAVMQHQGRPGFIRIRTPFVAEADAVRITAETAHLTRDPVELLNAQLPGGDLRRIRLTKPASDDGTPEAA